MPDTTLITLLMPRHGLQTWKLQVPGSAGWHHLVMLCTTHASSLCYFCIWYKTTSPNSSCLLWLIFLYKLPGSSLVLYKSHILWYWVQCPGCHGAAVCQTHTKQHRHTIVSKSNPSSLDTDASHKACVAKTIFLKTALGHEPLPLLLPWPWPWPLP